MKDTLTILTGRPRLSYVVTDSSGVNRLLSRRPIRKFAEIYECTCGTSYAEHLHWCTSARLMRGLHDCSHLRRP